MVKEQKKGKKKEVKKQSKHDEGVEIYTGTFTNDGKGYKHEFINGKKDSNTLTELIAKYLWLKYDRTRLTDDWNNETKQRQLRWVNDAEGLRGLVDEYYEE